MFIIQHNNNKIIPAKTQQNRSNGRCRWRDRPFCDSRNPQTLFWLGYHWHGLAPPADADDDAQLHTVTTHGIQLKNCTKIITYVIIAVTKVCYCGQQASNTHGARQRTHELRTKCWMLWCSRLSQTNTKQTFASILWSQPHHSCAIADSAVQVWRYFLRFCAVRKQTQASSD